MNRKQKKEKKEKSILCFIEDFLERHGYSPNFREIAWEFNCSTSTVHKVLHALKDEGLVDFEDGKYRTIKIIKQEG